ncbi:MAG: serine hydroxymethyltransferase, partial [Oscillospiraceae bacterium]|nr:serine hydroxymethyltransferase [Oscillospiraceae bacterium]
LMLVDLQNKGITGKELEHKLDEVFITANKNAVPNDPQSPFVTSGVRLGSPAVTSRGLKEDDMELIADCIDRVVNDFEKNADGVRADVNAICAKYPLYE